MTLTSGTTAIVVDASVTIEAVAGRAPWPQRWTEWVAADAMLLAPAHFRAEVANGMLHGTLGGDTRVSDRIRTVIQSGVDIADRGWHGLLRALELAERHRLTVYDAMYLHLALDVEAPLATLDRKLAAAARAEGVEVIDERAARQAGGAASAA
jgi:predicted nucleic acid-binding protein